MFCQACGKQVSEADAFCGNCGVRQVRTESNLVWRRTAVLDEEICKECDVADGSIISGPYADLSKICTNPEGCRCLQYSNLDEKT